MNKYDEAKTLEIENLRGQVAALEKMVEKLQRQLIGQAEAPFGRAVASDFFSRLTIKQNAVLQLLMKGMSNKVIASTIGTTEGSIKTHVRGIFAKVGASTRGQVVAKAGGPWRAIGFKEYFEVTGLPKDWADAPEADVDMLRILRGRKADDE